MNPLWEAAARSGDLQRLKQLHAHGAPLDQLDRYGQTALMLAAARGHAEVAHWLAECGANLNHTAKYGLRELLGANTSYRSAQILMGDWCVCFQKQHDGIKRGAL